MLRRWLQTAATTETPRGAVLRVAFVLACFGLALLLASFLALAWTLLRGRV